MIHLLYGDDDFSLEEALSAMKQEVQPPDLRDVNVTVLDGSQVSFDLLASTCSTVPFLAERRLVIVQGLLSLFERRPPSRSRLREAPQQGSPLAQWKPLAEYLPTVPPSTDLVFADGRLSQPNPLLALIRPHAKTRTFSLPGHGQLKQWIRMRAAAEKMEVEPAAVDELAETIGPDLRALAAELAKLALYHPGEAVRLQDVQELVSYTKEASIFAAVDAIIEGRLGNALTMVHNILQAGRPPAYVLTMIARQVRLLILAKDLSAQGVPPGQQGPRLGLTGYPLRKTQEQQTRFRQQRLVEIHRKLLETDLSMKTAPVNEELLIDLLITEVCGRPAGGARVPSPALRR